MNVLVTGATGFIGSHLVRKLLRLKHIVFICIRPQSDLSRINDLSSQLVKININSSLNEIHKTFKEKNICGVFHLATHYRKEDSDEEIEKMNDTNVVFPTRLLDFAKEYNSTFFVNTGTCFEYAQSKKPINENSNIQPYNYYASTKIKFDKILAKASQNSSFKAFTLKLFFPYGQQDNNKLVSLLIDALIKKTEFHVTRGGQTLSYTYIDDIVNAYCLLLNSIETMDNGYESFNIGGEAIKVSNIFDILEKISHTKGLIIRDKHYLKNEIMYMIADYKKAKLKFGWEPLWNLRDGLEKTYSYHLHHF